MMVVKRLALIAALAWMAAACWHRGATASATTAPATLQVENHNWQDVDIQVLHGGQRFQLGMVTGASSKRFAFPRSMMSDLGEVRLVAHAIGTPETVTTGVIVLKPGTRVQWTLQTSLSQSSLAVY